MYKTKQKQQKILTKIQNDIKKNQKKKHKKLIKGVQTTAKLSSSSGCGITDTGVGPASVMVGNLVQGNRLAVAHGRDVGMAEDGERKVCAID